MRYTVIWLPTALNELTNLWIDALDRAAVSSASDRIDRLLATAPLDHGESRQQNTRVLLVEPLGVEYEVDEADRKAQVNVVWHVR